MSDKKEIATMHINISVDSTDLDKLEGQLKRIEGLMVIYTVQLNLTPIDQLGKDTSGNESEKLKAQIANWLFPEDNPVT